MIVKNVYEVPSPPWSKWPALSRFCFNRTYRRLVEERVLGDLSPGQARSIAMMVTAEVTLVATGRYHLEMVQEGAAGRIETTAQGSHITVHSAPQVLESRLAESLAAGRRLS